MKSYIRLFSDVHLNCCVPLTNTKRAIQDRAVGDDLSDVFWTPVELPTDKDTTLVLAGDIWEADKSFSFNGWSWMAEMSKRFKAVVFCLGNHDYWSANFDKIHRKIAAHIADQKLLNVFCLNNSSVELDGVRYIGGTLWTDLRRGDPLTVLGAPSVMSDFKYIRAGSDYSKFSTTHWLDAHRATKNYIFEALGTSPQQPTIVVTHHLPTYRCISPEFKHGPYGSYYASDLDALIYDASVGTGLLAWFHGHTHDNCHVTDLGAPIIANPFGYLTTQSQLDSGIAQNQKFDIYSRYEVVADGDRHRLQKCSQPS